MTVADLAPAYRPVPSPLVRAFRAVAQWVSARAAEHRSRVAIEQLRFEPEHRLRDLGIHREATTTYRISREDLIQAMGIHRK